MMTLMMMSNWHKNCSEAEILLSCNNCEFQTKYPNNLERHKQLHQNVKKRKNENTSSQKASLKKQKLDILECDICKVTFTIKGNLTRHKRNKHEYTTIIEKCFYCA